MCIFVNTAIYLQALGSNFLVFFFQVAKSFIPYAVRAKKVDMRRLKLAIWDILDSTECCKVRNNLHAKTSKYFLGTVVH
jgi:hypothetical protein